MIDPADKHAHPLVPVYSPELFRGTADYYARFRPRYPPVLLDAIERTVGLDHGGHLLDLACGTGEVSVALAERVSAIWAIDLEPEMVAVARQTLSGAASGAFTGWSAELKMRSCPTTTSIWLRWGAPSTG